MDKDKIIEAAKLNLIKYIFDESANEIQLSELKKVGIGSFIDGAEWRVRQGELPEGCVRKQVAEAKEALYSAPCADTINGQGNTNQVSQSVTKISDQVSWSEEDEEELGIAIKYLQREGQWDSATWIKSLKTRLKGE